MKPTKPTADEVRGCLEMLTGMAADCRAGDRRAQLKAVKYLAGSVIRADKSVREVVHQSERLNVGMMLAELLGGMSRWQCKVLPVPGWEPDSLPFGKEEMASLLCHRCREGHPRHVGWLSGANHLVHVNVVGMVAICDAEGFLTEYERRVRG